MTKRIDRWRVLLFMGAAMALLLLVGYRVFVIAYVRHSWYSTAARSHADGSRNILARGAIYFESRGGALDVAATNKRFPIITVNASQVPVSAYGDVTGLLTSLAGVASGDVSVLLSDARDLELPVGRYLDDAAERAVEASDAPGIGITYETDRFYPGEALAADVIGFFGYDPDGRHGQYGVEAYYEKELAGHDRPSHLDASPRGLWHGLMAVLGFADEGGSEGDVPLPADVVLTVDRTVQAYAQDALADVLERYDASAGSVIVQEVTTGRIVAMADSPSFDPNRYGSSEPAAFLNAPTQRSFEPGSSFKPFTMAIGLDTGAVSPTSTYTDTGSIQVAGHTIRNFTDVPFGTVTMTRILEKSINTGVMHVERLVGDERFLEYVIDMGFGQKTGVDLPGEASGNIENLYSGRAINFLTASFGQGITVTPLQLAAGYSAIANDGKLMKPYIVDRVVRDGAVLYDAVPEVAGIPFSQKTAGQVRDMLVSVVDNGFDKARIPRYDVAGKTGTAQIAGPSGGYLEDEYIHSFAGFIPASAPQFTIIIVMERPRGVTFAADSLSSVFRDLATFLIHYYGIPPTR
ncbi:MAG TPA: penicillin-binding protein 2 [Candidatus Paceibacterota bacterium]|nr:penicillin-binding protein 2 [Candidatus Paceibacterota bacterium]